VILSQDIYRSTRNDHAQVRRFRLRETPYCERLRRNELKGKGKILIGWMGELASHSGAGQSSPNAP